MPVSRGPRGQAVVLAGCLREFLCPSGSRWCWSSKTAAPAGSLRDLLGAHLPRFRRPRGHAVALAGCLLGAWAAPESARADEAEAAAGAENAGVERDDQSAEQERPPRPPLPPEPTKTPLPWERHIEIGGDLALVARPASTESDGGAAGIRYQPTLGYGVHARWEMLRFLRFTAYFVHADHDISIPPGALGVPGEVETPPVDTIVFGARLAPTLELSKWARSWISAGIGYGRFNFEKMTIPALGSYEVRERAMSFAEVPLGVGMSLDLICNWLTLELEVSGAFALGQEGESTQEAQLIDRTGRKHTIGALPKIDGSFVQTVGLSLVL